MIDKAKDACKNVGQSVVDHFPDVRKTIAMPKGAEKEIDDYLLTRYACYLVAQNGDPRKDQHRSATHLNEAWTRLSKPIA